MTKNDDNSARLRRRAAAPLRAKTVGQRFLSEVAEKKWKGKKNHEMDTREIEGKVLPLADDSRDGRVRELCFVAIREIEFRMHSSARLIATFFLLLHIMTK